MSKRSKVVRMRIEDEPQYQNRPGPDGCTLDPTEAVAWFPPLDEQGVPHEPQAGGRALVACEGLRFWLRDVTPSIEPGVYFGDVEWPDDAPEGEDRYFNLAAGQNIGFEPKHVLEIAAAGTTPAGFHAPWWRR